MAIRVDSIGFTRFEKTGIVIGCVAASIAVVTSILGLWAISLVGAAFSLIGIGVFGWGALHREPKVVKPSGTDQPRQPEVVGNKDATPSNPVVLTKQSEVDDKKKNERPIDRKSAENSQTYYERFTKAVDQIKFGASIIRGIVSVPVYVVEKVYYGIIFVGTLVSKVTEVIHFGYSEKDFYDPVSVRQKYPRVIDTPVLLKSFFSSRHYDLGMLRTLIKNSEIHKGEHSGLYPPTNPHTNRPMSEEMIHALQNDDERDKICWKLLYPANKKFAAKLQEFSIAKGYANLRPW
ncbi:MAG: hypothetical protein HZB76_00020 [Chlamydiae bacterium]|nr:hypothetical protein [Chlamydiota bacterium]